MHMHSPFKDSTIKTHTIKVTVKSTPTPDTDQVYFLKLWQDKYRIVVL